MDISYRINFSFHFSVFFCVSCLDQIAGELGKFLIGRGSGFKVIRLHSLLVYTRLTIGDL